MATGSASDAVRPARGAARSQPSAAPTDGQLLQDHLARRDPAALAALVERHGPMV